MNIQVRYFLLELTLLIQQRCLQGANSGKLANSLNHLAERIHKELPGTRQFSDPKALAILLQSKEMIVELADKLADGDWDQLCTVINLLEQVKDGQVLIVEKEQYDALNEKFEEDLNNVAQI
jgi:hypothetical protein